MGAASTLAPKVGPLGLVSTHMLCCMQPASERVGSCGRGRDMGWKGLWVERWGWRLGSKGGCMHLVWLSQPCTHGYSIRCISGAVGAGRISRRLRRARRVVVLGGLAEGEAGS